MKSKYYQAGLGFAPAQVRVAGVGDTVAKVGVGIGALVAIPLVLIGGLALASLGGGK